MAPSRVISSLYVTSNNKVATRSRAACHQTTNLKDMKDGVRSKRKAEGSPSKEKGVKRTALTDLTNNGITKVKAIDKENKITKAKKTTITSKVLPSVKTVFKQRQNENLAPPPAPAANKILTRAAVKHIVVPNQTAVKPKEAPKETTVATKKRLSNEFEKNEESLYSTALEEINDSTYYSAKKSCPTRSTRSSTESSPLNKENKTPSVSFVVQQLESKLNLGNHDVPEGVLDFDKENWDDIFQVSHYAMDIFNYLKDREELFPVGDYMERQICLTKWMRSLLVDWMVEIQESFELNHETLYLGVKLVDMYLDRMTVAKETLQLVGAAAMFVASKFDERIPPLIDDFLYICDGAYTRREMIKMEMNLLKVTGFDLGIPISYRFLRRYARCAKMTMPVLTLARFILEYSLMDYDTVTLKESILASAALYLALRMKQISKWTPTLEFYTGYKLQEIKDTALLLNRGLMKPPKSQLMTVRNKYSHKIFFEVAKTPLISNADL